MASSADRRRLFSCGTNTRGEYFGEIKKLYDGLGKQSEGVVQFDTMKSQVLAVGDESQIKFWDMDKLDMLTAIDEGGGLQASPCLRSNKEGVLLAVSTRDHNGIKILANVDGVRLLRSVESCAPYAANSLRVSPALLLQSLWVYPDVTASRPSGPNQLALGHGYGGGVPVLEPPESKGNLGAGPSSKHQRPAC